MLEVKKVDNPLYQDMDEISKSYWNNWLLISNLTDKPDGGIVQYYCPENKDELWDIVMDMDRDYGTYGDCTIRFVGSGKGDSLGGLFL